MQLPVSSPARTFSQALDGARAFMSRDDDEILPQARTALLEHGETTPLAVVLFHGITNNPAQFTEFAPLLYSRGANVFVPRMPLHGYRDRMTARSASVTAEMLLLAAGEAIDAACGLGERVAVLGISMGGLLAAYCAQFRPIALAVPVAPCFALLRFSYPVNRIIERVALRLPNFFLWWDPRVREHKRPDAQYPRFSSHALMQSLRIGEMVYAAARRRAPLAERIVTLVNQSDPAVNNAVTKQVCAMWSARKPDAVAYAEIAGLPQHHDIIDPQQPRARTDLAYPKLLEALGVAS
jgi:alpha-beta hydrolase superfamily lysophospholipase